MGRVLLAVLAVGAATAAVVWGRSARNRARMRRRLERTTGDADLKSLMRSDQLKDTHTALLYAVVAVAAAVGSATEDPGITALVLLGALVPVGLSLGLARNFSKETRSFENRSQVERRAQEVLTQEALAPKRWAERLAPEELPSFPGYDIGRVYQPGSGMMAGDFYDLFRLTPTRLAAVIGDVSGSGIDPAITAFQAKYLLRVFLRQYRDPAQAMEELNRQMSALGRLEEFISACVAVFDTQAGTVRYVSAGHPAAFLWHDKEVQPLRATGPLLMLDPDAGYYSREIDLAPRDLLLVYTDGLAEAREGANLFGEERVAATLRRDPGVAPDVLCKTLLEAATDFSSGPITDDVAILAIRRS